MPNGGSFFVFLLVARGSFTFFTQPGAKKHNAMQLLHLPIINPSSRLLWMSCRLLGFIIILLIIAAVASIVVNASNEGSRRLEPLVVGGGGKLRLRPRDLGWIRVLRFWGLVFRVWTLKSFRGHVFQGVVVPRGRLYRSFRWYHLKPLGLWKHWEGDNLSAEERFSFWPWNIRPWDAEVMRYSPTPLAWPSLS